MGDVNQLESRVSCKSDKPHGDVRGCHQSISCEEIAAIKTVQSAVLLLVSIPRIKSCSFTVTHGQCSTLFNIVFPLNAVFGIRILEFKDSKQTSQQLGVEMRCQLDFIIQY